MSSEFLTEDEIIGNEAPRGVEFSTLNEPHEGNYQVLQLTGVTFLGGAFVGASVGSLQGIRDASTQSGFKPRMNAILNATGKSSSSLANRGASTVLTYGAIKKLLYYSAGLEENTIANNVISAATVGAVTRAPASSTIEQKYLIVYISLSIYLLPRPAPTPQSGKNSILRISSLTSYLSLELMGTTDRSRQLPQDDSSTGSSMAPTECHSWQHLSKSSRQIESFSLGYYPSRVHGVSQCDMIDVVVTDPCLFEIGMNCAPVGG
eukprot:gene6398-7422_t